MKQKDWTVLLRDKDGLYTDVYRSARCRGAASAARRDHRGAVVVAATSNRITVYCGGTEWHEEAI